MATSKYDKNGNLNVQNSTLGDWLKGVVNSVKTAATTNTPVGAYDTANQGLATAIQTAQNKAPTTVAPQSATPQSAGAGVVAGGSDYLKGADVIAGDLGDVGSYDYKVNTGTGSGAGSGTSTASAAYKAYSAAIDEQNRILKEQQALAEQQRKAAMEATINANNQAADKSLKEAYIANMLAKRNLPQQLKAVGVSGGASETTLADIQNTYMNNRFGIEGNRNDANRQARLAYDNGVAGDYSNYLSKVYELQNGLAGQALALAASAGSGGSSGGSGSGAQTATGYKVGNITAKNELDLYNKLEAVYGQQAAEQYMINQGIVKPSAGRNER